MGTRRAPLNPSSLVPEREDGLPVVLHVDNGPAFRPRFVERLVEMANRPSAKSRAASTKTPAIPPVHSLVPKLSSNHAAIATASKCYSPISSASSNLVAFGFVARTLHSASSCSQPSRRTCAGSPELPRIGGFVLALLILVVGAGEEAIPEGRLACRGNVQSL